MAYFCKSLLSLFLLHEVSSNSPATRLPQIHLSQVVSKEERKKNTYHVTFAFEEGSDRVVQLLYRNRHVAVETGDLAGITEGLSRLKVPKVGGSTGKH